MYDVERIGRLVLTPYEDIVAIPTLISLPNGDKIESTWSIKSAQDLEDWFDFIRSSVQFHNEEL